MTQVQKSHYNAKSYDSKERLCSYGHQIEEIINLNPSSVLEIGVGNGFVSGRLKTYGLNVTTLDIDERLHPDKTGSVLSIPFADNSFDVTTCFQVLEHLPYGEFRRAISEILRVSKLYAIISLPDVEKCHVFYIGEHTSGTFRKYLEIPRKKKPAHIFDGEHYWEIGKQGYSLGKICQDIIDVGFNIERTYRIFENPYHRFFILNKEQNGKFKLNRIRLGNVEKWRDKCFEENLGIATIKRLLFKRLFRKD